MSKGLEALKVVDSKIRELKVSNLSGFGYEKLKENFKIIKQSLTPPTAKEVCKALSEWIEVKEVIYQVCSNDFRTKHTALIHKNEYIIYRQIDLNNLPPRLITLIGRFYEGIKDNE